MGVQISIAFKSVPLIEEGQGYEAKSDAPILSKLIFPPVPHLMHTDGPNSYAPSAFDNATVPHGVTMSSFS